MCPFAPVVFDILRRSFVVTVMTIFCVFVGVTNIAAQDDDDAAEAVAAFNEAQNFHEKGDLPAAVKLYEKALALLPEFPEAHYQRGTAQLALGNIAEAERSLRRSVELRGDWTLAIAGLASVLVQKGEGVEAERLLQQVLAKEPQNPPALIALAELRLKGGAPHDALQELLAKLSVLTAKANPTVSLWTARAALETALGQIKAAKSSLANALAIEPKNTIALFQVADLAISEGDISRASEIAGRLESAGAGPDRLRLLRATLLVHDGKLDEAVKQLDAIERPTPASNELRRRIDASRAVNPADLEQQLASNAKDPVLLGRLCTLYRREDPAKAIEYCRRASEAEPGNLDHAIGFGAALVQAKQFDAAVNIFKRILEIAHDNLTVRANLATALFQLKRYAEAKVQFVWLTEAQPTSATAYFFLGIVHDQLNEYLDAMANYQQYLRLADPVANKLDIERVNLRLPSLQKLVKSRKGKK